VLRKRQLFDESIKITEVVKPHTSCNCAERAVEPAKPPLIAGWTVPIKIPMVPGAQTIKGAVCTLNLRTSASAFCLPEQIFGKFDINRRPWHHLVSKSFAETPSQRASGPPH
jgi:hypothetical protein